MRPVENCRITGGLQFCSFLVCTVSSSILNSEVRNMCYLSHVCFIPKNSFYQAQDDGHFPQFSYLLFLAQRNNFGIVTPY